MELLTGDKLYEAEQRMYKAAEVAKGAKCLRALCGTVIVKDGEIIGTWYNTLPGDEAPTCCMKKDRPAGFKSDAWCCIHAEQRAIMNALYEHREKIQGSTLYFTRIHEDGSILYAWKPFCTICSKMALDSGVGTFVLWHEHGIIAYDTKEYNDISFAYNGD